MVSSTTPPANEYEDTDAGHKFAYEDFELEQVGDDEITFFRGTEVVSGLTRTDKRIPSKYYYDNVGSMLFEIQCKQPEYYLSRVEAKLLDVHIDEITPAVSGNQIIELGSGSSSKTKAVIRSHQKYFGSGVYVPTDINRFMVKKAAKELLEIFVDWRIQARIGTFQQVVPFIPRSEGARLFLFLGSTIGNLTDREIASLLRVMCRYMTSNDAFLVGVDLEKGRDELEAAYNDRNNVAALTNLNTLSHLNWRFDGNIRVDEFEHYSFYNSNLRRMESHVRALNGQCIQLRELGISAHVRRGETIRTEIMRKFSQVELTAIFERHGFHLGGRWLSPDPSYALFLFRRTRSARCGE